MTILRRRPGSSFHGMAKLDGLVWELLLVQLHTTPLYLCQPRHRLHLHRHVAHRLLHRTSHHTALANDQALVGGPRSSCGRHIVTAPDIRPRGLLFQTSRRQSPATLTRCQLRQSLSLTWREKAELTDLSTTDFAKHTRLGVRSDQALR